MGNKVYVWDTFVRIFHWSLVALFVTSYVTGEEETILHIYSGYAILALVVARILWGFIGSRYARFRDFVKGPREVMEYARSMASGKPKHYLGHNPLGGLMVLALLAALLMTTVSGLKLYAVEEGKGPLASTISVSPIAQAYAHGEGSDHGKERKEGEEFWEEIHEFSVNLMLLLIALHIGGVVVSSRLHRESLVKAMVTGYKEENDAS